MMLNENQYKLALEDLEKLSPHHLGLDYDNFLYKELGTEAEDMKRKVENFKKNFEIIDADEFGDYNFEDLRAQLLNSLLEVMYLANTRILYLIYRQVKLVYTSRQKQKQHDKTKRRTEDFGHGGPLHQSRSLAFVGQNSHSMLHLDTEPEEQQYSQNMSLGHESFNQSEKISNVQQSLGKKSNT